MPGVGKCVCFLLSLLLVKSDEATDERRIAIGQKVGCSWFPRREASQAVAGKQRGKQQVKNLSCAAVSTGVDGYGDSGLALQGRHCPQLSDTCTG